MSLRRHRGESISMYGGHGSEKALSDICPRLRAGISLNTRRYMAVLNENKNATDDTTAANTRLFASRGSLKRQSMKSEVPLNGSSINTLNESANISLCSKVYFRILNVKNMIRCSKTMKLFNNIYNYKMISLHFSLVTFR